MSHSPTVKNPPLSPPERAHTEEICSRFSKRGSPPPRGGGEEKGLGSRFARLPTFPIVALDPRPVGRKALKPMKVGVSPANRRSRLWQRPPPRGWGGEGPRLLVRPLTDVSDCGSTPRPMGRWGAATKAAGPPAQRRSRL